MDVKIAESVEDLRKISSVLLELRSQYSVEALIEQIQEQQQDNYQIAYVEEDGNILSVAGFVIGKKLAWQKHIYVDDLITSKAHRSLGAGKLLMDWLKNYAKENGCQQIQLDSGVLRFSAHKFYLREGFIINSHHFGIAKLNED